MNINHEFDEMVKQGEQQMFVDWMTTFQSALPHPIHNFDRFSEAINTSRVQQTEVGLLFVGCQNWRETSEGSNRYTVTPIEPTMRRAKQTARRIANIQTAFDSFGIRTKSCLTISRTEAVLATTLANNRTLAISEAGVHQVSEQSQATMEGLIVANGGTVDVFNDLEVMMQDGNCQTYQDLYHHITGTSAADESTFYRGFYHTMTRSFPRHMATLNRLNDQPVWMDLMSPLAGSHREDLKAATTHVAPPLAMVVPSINSGKWWSDTDEEETPIPTKVEFVSASLGIDVGVLKQTDGRTAWLSRVQGKNNSHVTEFLNHIGVQIPIDTGERKLAAVRLIDAITFGDTTGTNSLVESQGTVSTTILSGGRDLRSVFAQVKALSPSQARKQIQGAGVWVRTFDEHGNESKQLIKDPTHNITPGSQILVAKKTYTRIDFDED